MLNNEKPLSVEEVAKMTNKNTLEKLKTLLGAHSQDQLTFSNGRFTLRKGYYWRSKQTPEESFAKALAKLTEAGYKVKNVEYGDHYTNFKGGESVKKNSHFWLKFSLEK